MDESKQEKGEGRGQRLSRFARSLLAEWRLRAWRTSEERLIVAVSGGADSSALLLALDELMRAGRLKLKLTIAHLDHGLRADAGVEDARWVGELTRELDYEYVEGHAATGERARATRDNLEQAARRARYEFLNGTAERTAAAAILTAHTLDDQAETFLLGLMRGSGADGLSGMRVEREIEEGSAVMLRRPLLTWARRAETESYCRERGIEFRIDAMNDDERFARVRVRRRLLPLLAEFNPRVVESLARTADLLREDTDLLGMLAEDLLDRACAAARPDEDENADDVHVESNDEDKSSGKGKSSGEGAGEFVRGDHAGAAPLCVAAIADAPAALRRRALRLWLARGRGGLRRIESAHLLAVERLLSGERGGRVAELPGGSRIERRRGLLYFRCENI